MLGSDCQKNIVLLSIFGLFCFSSVCFAESREYDFTAAKKLSSGGIFELSYKSKIDGSIQPFLVKVPQNYTNRKKWPFLVTLHGLGGGPLIIEQIDSMVQIGPFSRGSVWYSGIGEEDVFECLDFAKELFSIDPNRIYLCGFSMGGEGAFNLGLGYPDMWTACVPVCGRINDANMVANGLHLPFWINTGRMDTVLPPRLSKRAYDKAVAFGLVDWHYTEYPNMGHAIDIDWGKIEEWLLTKKRTIRPSRVCFTTKNLNANKAYWAEIIGIKEYGKNSNITAVINGSKVTVDTDNVSSYLLRLAEAPIDLGKKIEVIENDKKVFKGFLKDSNGLFEKKSGQNLTKKKGLCGPLWDISRGSCIFVYGTDSADANLVEAAKSCAESFCNPQWSGGVLPFNYKLIDDVNVSGKEIAKNNLVLFGNAETNKILAQISTKLPIRMENNVIKAKRQKFTGSDIGFILVYPNPLNQEKYVAIFAGNTVNSINCFKKIWPKYKSVPKDIDAGVFEIDPNTMAVKWRLKELFGSDWNWQ